MDDLDPNRCTAAYATACIEDMRGMGLDWDEGPNLGGPSAPYEQSKRSSFYIDAMKKLYQLGLIYPCKKSRKEIRAYGLVDATGNEYLYPESFPSPKTDIKNLRISRYDKLEVSKPNWKKSGIFGRKKSRTIFPCGKRYIRLFSLAKGRFGRL